jgi:hypothetical protein
MLLQAAKEIDSTSNTNSPIIGVFLHSHPNQTTHGHFLLLVPCA